MISKEKNYAFIDGANLHQGIKSLGWELDYHRFRVWLKEKYSVIEAYLFIGLVSKNTSLYTRLQQAGYILVFKETTLDGDGIPKGNCDADLVLRTVIGYYEKEYAKAIIISSDGDYASLVKFLKEKDAFFTLISPRNKCSYLLRKLNIPILYLATQKNLLSQKEKAPDRDGTL